MGGTLDLSSDMAVLIWPGAQAIPHSHFCSNMCATHRALESGASFQRLGHAQTLQKPWWEIDFPFEFR
eukprot:6688245-Alexandrium_andersonii.AAC.1